MKAIGSKYLLRNVHSRKMDVVISDLHYKIPSGCIRNLLSSTSRLKIEDIQKSRECGSIAKRIQQGALIEVEYEQQTTPPKITVALPSAVSFPQRIKSSIVIEVSDLYEDQDKNGEEDILSDFDFNDK